MEIAKIIIINSLLVLLFFVALAISSTFSGHSMNKILLFIVIACIILFNSKKFRQVNKKLKIIIFLSLFLLALGYIIIPKKNTSCGVPKNGRGCTMHYCMGIPMRNLTSPACLGISFGEKSEWFPD